PAGGPRSHRQAHHHHQAGAPLPGIQPAIRRTVEELGPSKKAACRRRGGLPEKTACRRNRAANGMGGRAAIAQFRKGPKATAGKAPQSAPSAGRKAVKETPVDRMRPIGLGARLTVEENPGTEKSAPAGPIPM